MQCIESFQSCRELSSQLCGQSVEAQSLSTFQGCALQTQTSISWHQQGALDQSPPVKVTVQYQKQKLHLCDAY